MGRPRGIPHTDEWKQAQAERMKGNQFSAKPKKWRIEDLPAAVQQSKSWTELCGFLDLRPSSTESLKWRIKELGLNTDHFTSEWGHHHKLADDAVFCENSHHMWAAKQRFYKQTPEVCMLCGQGPIWNGKPLRFQIDHENGDSRDCRRENLRKICPNCHTQTDTYAGRNNVKTDGTHDKLNGETIWCNGCHIWLNPNEFGNKASMPNGKQSQCKNCMNGIEHAWT
jgi:hypothetical protein